MFSPGNAQQLQSSFADFCKRPENRAACEAAQRQELKQGLKAKEAAAWLEFEAKVLQLLQGHMLPGPAFHAPSDALRPHISDISMPLTADAPLMPPLDAPP